MQRRTFLSHAAIAMAVASSSIAALANSLKPAASAVTSAKVKVKVKVLDNSNPFFPSVEGTLETAFSFDTFEDHGFKVGQFIQVVDNHDPRNNGTYVVESVVPRCLDTDHIKTRKL